MNVDLHAVGPEDKPVVANLLQLYLHDFSEFEPRQLSTPGTFDYAWLDSYFTASNQETSDREGHLISSAGRPAGFAFVRCDVPGDNGAWNVSEFFVVRGCRRLGIGKQAARLLFSRHPGPWTLSHLVVTEPASLFWRGRVSEAAFGPVSRKEQGPPEVPTPKIRLRFEVRAGQA